MSYVVDASAVLAMLFEEAGGDVAATAVKGGVISTVNLIEVLQRFADQPDGVARIGTHLDRLELTHVAFDRAQARIAAELEPRCRTKNISLADRACFALAIVQGREIVTADRIWAKLNLGIEMHFIR